MEHKFQRRVQRYGWDKAAKHYEGYWQEALLPAQDKLLGLLDLQPGQKVLEIAAGTGLVTCRVAEAIRPDGHLTATDLSEGMLAVAREIAGERKLTNIVFERCGAEALPFEDHSFDVVFCALGLMYVPDPRQAFKEFFRVLKPGGKAASAVWGERRNCGWAEIFPIVDSRIQSEVCPMFFQLGGPNIQDKNFENAGFTQVRSERLSNMLYFATADDACGAAFAGGPVALAYSRFDDATREAAHQDYLDSIAAYHTDDGYRIPGEFVVTIGSKP